MSLRLLGGIAKSFELQVPPGHMIRPMAVTLKRRVFDAYQDFSDYTFYDVCGGSGSVGLEAWSRNAKLIYFTEKSPKVYKILKANVKKITQKYPQNKDHEIITTLSDGLNWYEAFEREYKTLSEDDQENTILFFAPPYPLHDLYEEYLKLLKESSWYKGQWWIESDRQKGVTLEYIEEFLGEATKVYKQGTTFVAVYR